MSFRCLITLAALLLGLVSNAQISSRPSSLNFIRPDVIAPSIRFESLNRRTLSLGISFLKFTGDDIAPNLPVWNHFGPSFESGIDFGKDSKYLINKIGYEYYFLFFGGRLNVIHTTNFTHHYIGLQPEIGLSIFGVLQINYGYAITKDNGIGGGHILGIGVRWPSRSTG